MNVGPEQILFSCLLVFITIGLSFLIGLNLEKKLFIAQIRSIVQLILLGYALLWFFKFNHPLTFFALFLFMILVATHTVSSRVRKKFKGLGWISFHSLFLPALITGLYTFFYAIPQTPWYDVNKTIPLFGMIIGNSLTGISLSLDSFINAFSQRKNEIEDLLAMGATRMESVKSLIKNSLNIGMTPILNTMNVVGLVSIPGMMTGQILAGMEPFEAAKYQISIMLIICFVIFLSSMGALIMATLRFFDVNHRFKSELLTDE